MTNKEKDKQTRQPYEYYLGTEVNIDDELFVYNGKTENGFEFIKTGDNPEVMLMNADETRKLFNKVRFNENKEKVNGVYEQLNKGFEAYFSSSDMFKQYLDMIAVHKDKSARNAMLILMQKPDATIVKSLTDWNKLHRSVNKGEKGITLLEPVFKNITDKNGKKHKQFSYMRTISGFDASQLNKSFSLHPPYKEMPNYRKGDLLFGAATKILDKEGKIPLGESSTIYNVFEALADSNNSIKALENEALEQFAKEASTHIVLKTVGIDSPYNFDWVKDFSERNNIKDKYNFADCIKSGANTILNKLERELPDFFRKPKENTKKNIKEKSNEQILLDTVKEHIETPIGTFNLTTRSLEEMKQLGFNESYVMSNPEEDIEYHIVSNGNYDFAVEVPILSLSKETNQPIFKIEANPSMDNVSNAFFVQSYIPNENGKLDIGEIVYIGDKNDCRNIAEALNEGTMTPYTAKGLSINKLSDYHQRENPVYKETFEYATAHNEQKMYDDSSRLNKDCAKYIAELASDHYSADDHIFGSNQVVKQAIEKYGAERVQFVVANTVQLHQSDGRISNENKQWANAINIPSDRTNRFEFAIPESIHIGLINLIAKETTEQLRDNLSQTEHESEPNSLKNLVAKAETKLAAETAQQATAQQAKMKDNSMEI